MKTLKTIILFSVMLYGCGESTPPEYLEAKVLEVTCLPIAQITGSNIGEKWKGYENVVVINNPFTDGIFIPSDSIFYFRTYELTEPMVCGSSAGYAPGINIRILGFSPTKP